MKKKNIKPTHRLFIKVEDKNKESILDQEGIKHIFVKWVEVQEINLGSIKNPNREILEIKMEPIREEEDEDEEKEKMSGRWFRFPGM